MSIPACFTPFLPAQTCAFSFGHLFTRRLKKKDRKRRQGFQVLSCRHENDAFERPHFEIVSVSER